MSTSRSILLFPIGAAIALALLSACAGGTPGAPGAASAMPNAERSAASRPKMDASGCGKSVVYATSYSNSVYIYDQVHSAGTPCGQITGVTNPQGLFVDKARDLWVAIAGDCRTQFSSVLEFAPGGSAPIKTLTDSAGPATDVAVDNKSGTVYVTNFFNYTKGCISGNDGTVQIYANGSTTPTGHAERPEHDVCIQRRGRRSGQSLRNLPQS